MNAEGTWRVAERSTRAHTMAALALAAPAAHSQLPALRSKRDGAWVEVSYPALGEEVLGIARGLIALGVKPGDKVAILAETRAEWTCVDLGALACGATVVPVYPTSPPDDCAYVIEHSEARVVFCDTPAQVAKVSPSRTLEHVVVFDPPGEPAISLDELVARGAGVPGALVEERARAVTPEDLCTLVYTSGTTGKPKGCMLSHGNLRANLDMIEAVVPPGRRPVLFAFLPLAHALTRMLQLYAVDVGGTIAYWNGVRETLLADLADARPTQLASVPRLYEKVHAAIEAGVQHAGPVRRRVFHFAIAAGRSARERERAGRRKGRLLRARLEVADRTVLSKVRAAFGGRLEIASTGAAPTEPELVEFFHACGIPVMEGYGLTESTAVTSINHPAALAIGTTGRPLPGAEVRIADDGEILIRGPHVFQGYYKDPEATRGAFLDGWLRSGDLGALDTEGFLRIVGRKKDIIVTSSGKNISPAKIEDQLRRTRWISHAVVYGDNRPYLVALITLDPEEAPALGTHSAVTAEIQSAVERVNRGLARVEQIKRFTILERELSQELGELTPTLKVKRAVVYDRFADEIRALYEAERAVV